MLLGFSTVYREGFETVLFLQALELNSGLAVVVEGVVLGAIAVGAVAVATFKLERKLPYRKMLIVTGILLTAVLAILVGKTVRTMQGVGWVPITPIDIELPYWTGIWLGIFPTVETVVAQIASVVFVIASYFAAERLKHRPKGRSAAGLRPAAHGPDDAAQAYAPDAGNAARAVDTADAGHARGAAGVPDARGNGSAADHADAAHNGRAANHAGANGNAGAADHPGTGDGPGAADDPRARDAAGAAHHS